MFAKRVTTVSKFFWLFFAVFAFATAARGQQQCLSSVDAEKVVAGIKAQKAVEPNQNLIQELLQMRNSVELIRREKDRLLIASPTLDQDLKRQQADNAAALCRILRENGWTSRALVGETGNSIAANVFLDSPPEAQKQMLPVIEAAFEANEFPKNTFARAVDLLRVRAGRKQVFGTAIGVSNDLLLLYPIENERRVNELRKEAGLPALAEDIRAYERQYQAVAVRPPGSSEQPNKTAAQANEKPQPNAAKQPAQAANDEDEPLRVEANLVNLNATVLPNASGASAARLTKNDFVVSENGVEQPIEFFAETETPFDITLLIDVSGSTSGKNKLLRRTTRSFINGARANDRISIVVFDEAQTVLAPLTSDRKQLLAAADRIENGGGSRVWDALDFALNQQAQFSSPNNENRRRAIVFMTDGADNGFINEQDASNILFADLLDRVRRSDSLVIPIQIDTREDYGISRKLFPGARRALNLLADESGGLFYEARKFSELENVYSQVINDLSRIYSIGYAPADAPNSGAWRSVEIKLKNNPNLTVRARKGYYAH